METAFILENDSLRVEIPAATMSMRVTDKAAGLTWRMSDTPFDEVIIQRGGPSGRVTKHTLAGSAAMEARRMGPAAIIFHFADYRLQLLVSLDENRLNVQITPLEENDQFEIKGVVYPRGFDIPRTADAYSVLPVQQGMLVPGDWKEEIGYPDLWPFGDEKRFRTYGELFGVNVEWWSSFRPGYTPTLETNLSMPWWGAVDKRGSFMAVLDEDCWADSFLHVYHPAGGPTVQRLMWMPSRGRLAFTRRMTYYFYKGGSYVTLAKEYRKVAQERGKLVTLRAKNERNPTVGRLMGAPYCNLFFIKRDKRRFIHQVLMNFAEAPAVVEKFHRETGIGALHVQALWWQQWSHDCQYPDLCPPSTDAGGPAAFDAMATAIQNGGDVFGLSGDNYHDVSMESPLLDEAMLLRYADGSTNRRNYWQSGLTSLICTTQALKYLRRNFEVGRTDYPASKGLLAIAHPDTYWIGNFTSTYECYDARHPMTRNRCWEEQRRMFQYVNDCGILTHCEHPRDWVSPYFYQARTRQERTGVVGFNKSGGNVGVAVPLWPLVYHDCMLTSGDHPLLQLMNGAPPIVDLKKHNAFLIDRVKAHLALHHAVGFEEMTSHRFLSGERLAQETEFANGVKVSIDEARGRYRISGVQGVEDKEKDAGQAGPVSPLD